METVADYGTVAHFGVQTLTTGVFSVWLTSGNAGGAAQIAGVMLVVIVLLLGLERISRRNARFHRNSRQSRPVEAAHLRGAAAWLASVLCFVPFGLGFVLPVAVMGSHALRNPQAWVSPGLTRALANTFVVGGSAAVLTVAGALFLVYGVRMAGRGLPRLLLPVTSLWLCRAGGGAGAGVADPAGGTGSSGGRCGAGGDRV